MKTEPEDRKEKSANTIGEIPMRYKHAQDNIIGHAMVNEIED